MMILQVVAGTRSSASSSPSQKQQFLTINQLHDLLPMEDSDSNNSGSQMSDVSDDPFSLDDYEVEFVKPLRPHLPSPHEISVLDLCQQLSSHSKSCTVGTFLTKVNTREDADYVGTVSYSLHNMNYRGLPERRVATNQ